MCARVNACHNVGKAAYYTEGLYKNVLSAFGILLTVLRNIGTNAFSHLKLFVFLADLSFLLSDLQ